MGLVFAMMIGAVVLGVMGLQAIVMVVEALAKPRVSAEPSTRTRGRMTHIGLLAGE